MSKQSISITLTKINLDFLDLLANKFNISKSTLVDKILFAYKKNYLSGELVADASLDSKDDIDFSNIDIGDYLNIVDERN